MTDTVAAILKEEPEWGKLPAGVPQNVRCLLRRALEKDLRCRLRDIGDARIELEETITGRVPVAAATVAKDQRGLRAWISAGAALLLGVVATWATLQTYQRPAESPKQTIRFVMDLAPKEVIAAGYTSSVTISPDGSTIAYTAGPGTRRQLYIRRLNELEGKPIPGTQGASGPFFSWDAQWLGFRDPASRKIKRVALSGGAPQVICETDSFSGAAWGPDNNVYCTPGYPGGLSRVPASGGALQAVTDLDASTGENAHRQVGLLPDGKALIFAVANKDSETYDDARIAAAGVQEGKLQKLVDGGTSPRYSPSGHLVYARSGSLMAIPFDAKNLKVSGTPVKVLDSVSESVNTGAAHFAISPTGTLVYAPGGTEGQARTPVWVDRQGREKPLPVPPSSYLHPRISPDGRRIAIEKEGPNHDCWLYDLDRGTFTRITLDGVSHWPLWTPEGKRLTFRKWLDGGFSMWWVPADRSAGEERLTTIGSMQSPASWSPDGKVVAFTQVNKDTGADVYVLPLEGDRKPVPMSQTKFVEGSPKFSADGQWVAYCSNESGQPQVYVQPYPGPGPKIQVSTEGGTDPLWKRLGGELYYRDADKMMAVPVTTQPTFKTGKPQVLWERPYSHGMGSSCGSPGPTSANYDVTADGQRFLMIRDSDRDSAPTRLIVIVNWAEELKRLGEARTN